MRSVRIFFEIQPEALSNVFMVQTGTLPSNFASTLLKSGVVASQMREKARRLLHLSLRRARPVEVT